MSALTSSPTADEAGEAEAEDPAAVGVGEREGGADEETPLGAGLCACDDEARREDGVGVVRMR